MSGPLPPNLYRDFASLEPRACRSFAERYSKSSTGLPVGLPMPDGSSAWHDETFSLWQVLTAWDALCNRGTEDDSAEAERLLFPRRTKRFTFNLIARSATGPARREELSALVVSEINSALKRHDLTADFGFDPATLQGTFTLRDPKTLVAAIWTQAINAIRGVTSDYTRCLACRAVLERPVKKRGPASRFCKGSRCRARHDQKMSRLARALAKTNTSRRDIAAMTGLRKQRLSEIVAAVSTPRPRKRTR